MVVLVFCGVLQQHLSLLFIGEVISAQDFEQLFIVHLFKHAITAQIEVVACLNISGLINLRRITVGVGLHHSGDYIAVVDAFCLLRSDFAQLNHVTHHRMVASFGEDGSRRWTHMINATVTDVCHERTAIVQNEYT